MEFVEVTLNPLMAEFETEATSADIEGERKVRRYWTAKEEERFYEIWGRENWRLTRYGKNTVFFAKWAEELSEQWGIDVKPEEIQAKVNQAKAKYRQVMKCMEVEKTNVTKWKKFEIIDKILRNEHRPNDAEPISPEALEKSQDFSPVLASTAITMHQTAAAKATPAPNDEANLALQENSLDISLEDVNATETECVHTNALFNSNDSHSYSGELFSDRTDEIKREEFQEEFSSYANSTLYHQTRQPQLTPLQTPQQQQLTQLQTPQQLKYQQQQQQQQQQYKTQTQSSAPTSHPHQQLQQHIQQLQQEIHQQQQHDHQTQQQPTQPLQTYDQTLNSYTISTTSSNNSRSLLVNNHNQNAPNATPSVRPAVHSSATNQYANNYVVASKNASTEANANHTSGSNNINNNTNSTNTNSNNNGNSNNNSMHPPRTNAVVSTVISTTQSRKRRSSAVHGAAAASHAAADSLEVLYLEEVRKKNLILDEQKEISRKRLHLEERKIALMEQFFPKCLELQQQILQKLNSA